MAAEPNTDTAPLLSIRDLRIAFGGGVGRRRSRGSATEVVHGIDLAVPRGRVVALVGESGSGKSVTAMSVLRLLGPTATVTGSVMFDGTDLLGVDASTMRRVRGARIGMVFQEPMAAWNPVQTIGKQIAEALHSHDRSRSDTSAAVDHRLTAAGLDQPQRIAASYPHQLSGGQLQRAMVAMATSCDPDLLIADEPTTALDVTVQAGVLELLRTVATERGTGVLLITHDMGVVADIADEVVVLREGAVVERGTATSVLTGPAEDYTRMLLAAVPELGAAKVATAAAPGAAVASVRDLSVVFGPPRGSTDAVTAVDEVTLDLHAGRTLGLVGESGSGKSTLGRCLVGLVAPTSGAVELDGTALAGLRGHDLRDVQRRVGIVFQDPGSSLNPKHVVGRSVAEPLRLAGWSKVDSRDRVTELLELVRLDANMADRFPHQLSGGQRQRVAIARALALRPRVLVADEPTSALDVSVQASILDLIARLQQDIGFACLFISHDLAVVGVVADEVAVMREGRIVEHGPAARVLRAPTSQYAQRLLASAPVADPDRQRARREELARLLH